MGFGIVLALLSLFEIVWGALGFVWFGFNTTTLILAPIFMAFGFFGLGFAYEAIAEG